MWRVHSAAWFVFKRASTWNARQEKNKGEKLEMAGGGGLLRGIRLVKLGQGARIEWVKTTAFLLVLLCRVARASFSAPFVYCTIPESTEACFLVVLGGGGGGVLLGRGGGMC